MMGNRRGHVVSVESGVGEDDLKEDDQGDRKGGKKATIKASRSQLPS